MSYRIYLRHSDGTLETLEEDADHRLCEIYREMCRDGIEFEDNPTNTEQKEEKSCTKN